MNRWINISRTWIRRINTVKMSILPKAIYRFNAIPIKLPTVFLQRTTTNNFTICMEIQKKPQIAKAVLRKKNGTGGINIHAWLQTILQSYSHQDSMVLAQRQKYNEWDKTESQEINPHTYGHIIFDKGSKNIQWRKNNRFNKWCWGN